MKNTLLYLSFSPREDSVSSGLADSFIEAWKKNNTDAKVIHHALGKNVVDGPNDAWIKANMTPESDRTPEQMQRLAFSDEMIADLHHASHIVIATPMFNFTVPWSLKAYIDLIVRVGKTFSFDPEKGPGPLFDPKKKLLIVRSSAFDYTPGTPTESFDHLTPYLKFVFGFMGITKVESIEAGNQWAGPEAAQASTESALQKLSVLSSQW